MPIVSVIIPNYNHSVYLRQRIESVLSQTYQDFELILMDDVSVDLSREIIDMYSNHPKVSHTVYNQVNSGNTFKQWKKGINLAAGEFIWIAESDDWSEPTLLQTLVDGITSDDDCVISYCQSNFVSADGTYISHSAHWKPTEILDGLDFIRQHLAVPVAIFNSSMVLWKKEMFQFVPAELETFKTCGDWYFWIQLCKMGKVYISGQVLNNFRKHDHSVSETANKNGLSFIEGFKIIDQLYSENLITESAYYRAYKKEFIQFWMDRNSTDKVNKKIIIELFRNSLSTKVSLTKLIPIAILKKLQRTWKSKT